MIYMLHSVGNTHTDWNFKFLSLKLMHLENFFKLLNINKIRSYFVSELYDFDFQTPDNSVALSFDDGYVDNWVYLFPLLKKYNIKATIFVNPEFVDKREILRDQYLSEVSVEKQDKTLGFLSWNEMIEMENSGLVDIQSHSMSHTWYYNGTDLIDFFTPQDYQSKMPRIKQYPWISWNELPDSKPFTHNSNSFFSKKIGLPILENGRSLGIKRFFLDEDIQNHMVGFVNGNNKFFNNPDWFNLLRKEYEYFIKDKKEIGKYETEVQTHERYYYELNESKKILEEKLNKTITILCWPGGAYNSASVKLSEEAGYLASTKSSRDAAPVDNKNKKYKRIPRKPLTGNIGYKGKILGNSSLKNILYYRFSPSIYSNLLIKTEKLSRLVLKF